MIRRQIAVQKEKVIALLNKLSKIQNVEELVDEQKGIQANAEHRLEFYKKNHLEEKLQRRLNFDKDVRKAKEGIDLLDRYISDIEDLLAKDEDDIRNYQGYTSAENAACFEAYNNEFARVAKSIDTLTKELSELRNVRQNLNTAYEKLLEQRNGLSDEFAAIERSLAEELKSTDEQNISTDEFLEQKKRLATAQSALLNLNKSASEKTKVQAELETELQGLNDLWHQEFQIIKSELDTVSNKNTALTFTVDYKGDKSAFLDYFQNIVKGSDTRKTTLQNLVDKYSDFIALYKDIAEAKKSFGSNPDNLARKINNNLKALLTYQVPNKYTINYKGVPLERHSRGQRASALILFVLGQKENDVVMIDQPEDDLDNQTIYEYVIKLINSLKPQTQFIFATHNPNIPVLGDAEEIHVCQYKDNKVTIESGGIDVPSQQKNIVDIMEGGKEAFDKRKEIYEPWKS
jgi:predicted  nucleic acid-binding Zn-ribbon protein